MTKEKQPPPLDNVMPDSTGQHDLRLILWRHFCAQNHISVDTLPSQLSGELRRKWDELKAKRLG